MDIKQYIESGIIAAYVLGLASEAEEKEFEQLSKQYPELLEAKKLFELSLENQLIKEAVVIPKGLKQEILGSVVNNNQDNLSRPQKELNIPIRKVNIWKIAAAACFLLLLTSLYFTYYYREKYYKQKMEAINSSTDSTHTNPSIKLDSIVKTPSIKSSALLERNNKAHCAAHVYWDTVSAKTFLLVGNIPERFFDKQLQLWALKDNQPVNLGIFDVKEQGQLLQMKNTIKVKTFIITIEQKGGSVNPSMENLYAIGYL